MQKLNTTILYLESIGVNVFLLIQVVLYLVVNVQFSYFVIFIHCDRNAGKINVKLKLWGG